MNYDSTCSRSAGSRRSRPGRLGFAALSIALGAAMAVNPAGPGARPVAAVEPGTASSDQTATSIMYQQALEHANDPNTFVAGDAVSVPYSPRHGDTTSVDGGRPVSLPAGTASGRSMEDSPQGSIAAESDVAAPVAAPALAGSTASVTAQAQPATSTNVLRREVYGFLPYWESAIAPDLRAGKRVLVAAHGNSLRALVKYLDGISDDEIVGLNIPTGVPLVYDLDEDLRPRSSRYLGDASRVAAAMAAVAAQGAAKPAG